MRSLMFSSQWLQALLLALALSSTAAATRVRIPRLSPIRRTNSRQGAANSERDSGDLQMFYYNQTLDHFNFRLESYTKFSQRYVVNSKYWGGPNSAILAYLGAEESIEDGIDFLGFIYDTAPKFKALQIYIEHRYYGKSIPFGLSIEEVMKNESIRGYFNSAQALADYAEILLHIKKQLRAQHSPIIVVGASYGGMLAAWFRLKYPHVAVGALASSAPILYFDKIALTPPGGYYFVATNDFKEASETCYKTIHDSWAEIDRVAAKPNGLFILRQKFNPCGSLSNASDLKDYLEGMYTDAAQYDQPPEYPVNAICVAIDGANSTDDNILSKILAGVVANYGNQSCYFNDQTEIDDRWTGWQWQTCSELMFPVGIGNDTMFSYDEVSYNLSSFEADCKSEYGVLSRHHWVTTYYGGHDIKLVLRRFGSNIIFTNGLRDPYSSGGVLENLSESLLAVYTKNGSHCLDLQGSRDSDPEWLVEQREKMVEIIRRWLNIYNDDRGLIGVPNIGSQIRIELYYVIFLFLFFIF